MINNPNVENNWDQVNLMIPFYDDLLDTKYSFGPTTIDGNPTIVTNRSKFSQGSVEFNGTNERLFYQHTEFTRLEENDFTIECWVRPSVLGTSGGGSSSGRRGIFSTNTSTSSALYVYFQNDLMFCTISGVGSSASAEVEAGDWIHVAVSRTGFDTMFFVDGQLIHTFENEFYNLSSNTIVIGANNFSTGNAWGYLNGNIENFRLSKGVGRYTEEFFPPVVPYPTGNTVRRAINFFPTVRLKSDFGMDDCGPNERPLEYNIQPPTITYDVPFLTGNSSFYFNDSMISTGFDEDTQIGLNDFTIEAWIYMPNTNGRHTIFANYGYSQTNTCWFGIERGRIMVLNGAGNENLRGATNRYNSRFRRLFDHTDSDYEGIIDENRWHHVAWSREVRTNRVFLDGVEVARFNNRQNWSPRTQLFGKTYMRGFRIVGSGINRRRVYSDVTRYPFIGYMNDIQFNNMVCKYKSDFTPRIESDTDKVVAKSLFDRHNVDIDNFADRIVKDITYDAPNKNNIFWFNDISGFVLQKPEDHTTGISVTSAITDSQGVLNIRYSDGTSQSFTDVYEPIDQVSKTEGTGILYDVDGDVLKFKPLIGIGNAVVTDAPDRISISSNIDYSLGLSIDHSVTVGFASPRHVVYSNIYSDSSLPFNFIKDNYIGGSIENGSAIIPEGRYYITGLCMIDSSNMALINETNGDVIFNSTKFNNVGLIDEVHCYYTFRSPGIVRAYRNSYNTLTSYNNAGRQIMSSTITFFRIG